MNNITNTLTFLVIGADIMAKLGNKTTTVIPAKYVAAMKATENMDDIRHWLNTFNIQLSTKNKVWDSYERMD